MKLDELLKNNAKPLRDDGFTDRVMRNLSAEVELPVSPFVAWLARLELPGVEAAALAFTALIVAYFFPRYRIDPKVILDSVFSGLGLLIGLGVLAAYWFIDEPLFE